MGKKKRGYISDAKKFSNLSNDIIGMLLATAFIKAKNMGVKLRVNKLDNAFLHERLEFDLSRLNVDVIDGMIKHAWFG